ncbi:MAG TPA: metallophosphoesterase [Nitrososphaeraceae archaeon]|nr:metallophosphoesterase [Nitrososphaeraceae archaeon]
MVRINGNGKLALSLFSLLLLTLVTNSGSFIQKGQAASDTHIVAAGDWHCTPDAAKTISVAKSLNPQLILGLGDYSSTETDECWVNLSKPVDSITQIAIGNHDNEYDGLANSYLNHYGLKNPIYSYDIKNVHILTMATEDDFAAGSEQYNFVVNDLRKAANSPDTKWIIVTMHHPFYSSPNECSLEDCKGDEKLSQLYHPLFDKYGVDIVLQAHVRNYQRSFPIEFNQESPLNPTATSTSKSEYKNPNGPIFAIVGTGGGELKHELDGTAPFMAYQQDTKFGIIDMHFSDNTLDAKFVAIDGSTMDHFSLSKTAKKKVIERISEDTFSDTNIRTVSDKDSAIATPLAGQLAQDGKPSITFKLDEDASAGSTKANPSSQDGKPSITFKLDEAAGSSTTANANPLELQQDGKPSVTFKLDEAATSNTNPSAGQEVQEVKPAMTTKLDDNTPAKSNPMLLSEEQVEQEQAKPAMTTKLDDSDTSATDHKPASLSQQNAGSNDKDKSVSFDSNDNAGKSKTAGLSGAMGGNSDMSDEDSYSSTKTINTNVIDPFASLN